MIIPTAFLLLAFFSSNVSANIPPGRNNANPSASVGQVITNVITETDNNAIPTTLVLVTFSP
jgi:hypothetical protein